MFDFVPIHSYSTVYFNFLVVVNALTLFHGYILHVNDDRNINYSKLIGVLLLVFSILYIGLRPISTVFVDMGAYAGYFNHYYRGGDLLASEDLAFHYFMKFTSNFMGLDGFFLLCSILYIIPLYIVSKKLFKQYWFYAFVMFVGSFSFWAYGVNGIRNGIATSVFLLAFAYRDSKFIFLIFLLISCLFHKTMLLPSVAYILTLFYNNPKTYLKLWLLAIPLSLVLGGFWVSLFTSLGFGDDRLASYLTTQSDDTRFRWDFLVYSSSAVFVGWYFIIKKKYKDKTYFQLFNIYLTCNAFWILVIRANFSNRFAYLSWFIIALVIIYPYLKHSFYTNQNRVISKVLLAYYAFTYGMFLILD